MTLLRRGVAAIAIGGTALLLSACSTVTPTEANPDPNATPAPTTGDGGLFGGGWMTWILVALLVVMVFFMWRNSRKRKAAAQEAQSAMVPGAEVMTSFGLFGRLVAVDELTNSAALEISPGNVVKVHRQTLVKVVDPAAVPSDTPRSVEEAMEIADREQREREAKIERDISELSGDSLEEPRFGERITDTKAAEDGDEGDAPKKS